MPANENPYLALLQQEAKPPGWAQILQHIGNLGFGLAGGFGQAATTGQPTMAGIGPGLMMGNQLNAQAAQQAEKERMQRLELKFKAQEHEDKRTEILRKQKASEDFAKTLGFSVTPQQGPLMGPGGTPTTGTPSTTTQPGPDLKTGGAPLVDYLVAQHGLSPLAASTVVGNLYQESGFNPSATGDSGSAFGMAQWRLDRQTGLRNFAATQNKSVTDPQVQLDYLVSEMKGGDLGAQRAFAGLQQARTPQDANAAMMHFFRPAGYTPANPTGGHGFQNRVQNTQALLPNGQPAPQVAQGDAVAPQPRPGPTLSALPAFEGPGMGTTQPGALPEGALPSWNMPAAAPPSAPPGSPVTQSGAPVDPNAPPPPFVQSGGPNGPNVVQAQYQQQPGGPSMAPAAPPTRPPTPQVPPDPNFVKQLQLGIATGQINEAKAIELLNQHNADRRGQVDKVIEAQHQTNLEVYRQGAESRRHERGLAEQKAAEERRVAEEQRKHERGREEEGEWVRDPATGVERLVAKKDLKPGMTRIDKPSEPPAGYRKTPDGNFEIIPGGPADVAAKAGEAKQTAEQTKAQREDENKLRDDFDKAKPVQAYRTVVPMLESAKKAGPTRAGDLNLIYAFAKLMDPESVVRESETGMVTATGTFGDRLLGLTSQLTGGQALTAEMRKNLIAELDTRFAGLKGSYEAHEEAYRGIAERRGLDFNNVRIPIRSDKPAEPAPPPSGTFPPPPPAAIKALQMAPNQREDFDKMFGPGAAAKVLGR